MISSLLKKIICCPKCQKTLSAKKKSLDCLYCQKQYPLINNILIFEDSNFKKYKHLKNLPNECPFRYALHFWLYKKYLLRYLEPKPRDIILDIGCGLGHCLDFLSKFSKNLVGLDTDFTSLFYAQKTTKTDYVLSRGEKMPFKDNSFDKLLNLGVLEHIQDDRAALKEMVRVGKDKAKVLIMIPALEGPRIHSKLKRLMHDHESGGEKHYRDGYYLKDIKKLLNESGIKIVAARYTLFLFAELLTEFTKLFYLKKQKTYQRQTDLFETTSNKLFSLYKIIVPIIGKLILLEDFLFSHSKRGHALVIKGEIRKQ
jgi:ubiquinone/menaquinone biosynthesis C-methylase UbiE